MSNEELLAKIGQTTEETEFYTPMPPGYRKGHHKYVIVVGTVMSGLGKGIFSSSLAKLLQDKGLKVAPIKMEGYLNIDSGTLNPYRHGEVFVLDDGMETDMDLGTYERLLDQDLSAANFTTNGQILSAVLKKEREGGYLGRDVQVIPHVIGEIKLKLRELAAKSEGRRRLRRSRRHRRRLRERVLPRSLPPARLRGRRRHASSSSRSPTSSSPARSASRNPRPPSSASSG